jgi:hypothetical protein
VHAALREVSLDAKKDAVRKVVELQARIYGAPGSEASAAIEAVTAALKHKLMTRARRAERTHREYPFAVPVEDNHWLEGVIDLAFLENGQWVVVDFKTDASLDGPRTRYEQQLRWYGYALRTLTGLPTRAVLLNI